MESMDKILNTTKGRSSIQDDGQDFAGSDQLFSDVFFKLVFVCLLEYLKLQIFILAYIDEDEFLVLLEDHCLLVEIKHLASDLCAV